MTWKLGSVPYLNARPLLQGLDAREDCDLQLAVPSRLSETLFHGELDAALVPVAEYLRHDSYLIISDLCIACDGPVQSVCLFLRKPLQDIKRVGLDTASRTSRLLTRVVLNRSVKHALEYVDLDTERRIDYATGAPADDIDAFLVIGDNALRLQHLGVENLDLGQQWKDITGLPFVFAAWLSRDAGIADALSPLLVEARALGLANMDTFCDPNQPWQREYLTRNIQFTLTDRHREGLRLFHTMLHDDGLLPATARRVSDAR